MRSAVAARLGDDPFFPYAPATLFAELERRDGVFVAHVKPVDEHNVARGARTLKQAGPRCADLIDTIALSMSIAIDPKSFVGRQSTDDSAASAVAMPVDGPAQAEVVPPAPPPASPDIVAPTRQPPTDNKASDVLLIASVAGAG